jgi:DNA-binding GntR family transcriptional regulator
MTKIQYEDLSYQVYSRLKNMILSDVLKPGEKIVQEKLAEQIGVSRTPLLKALQMLEFEMLVESIPRRGMFVKEMSFSEMVDAFDCREGLEATALRRVSKNITEGHIESMRNIFKPFVDAEEIDRNVYAEADQKFHALMIELSQNQILAKLAMLGNLQIRIHQMGLVRPPKETLAEHISIIDALERHDVESAETLLKNHLRKSRDIIAHNMKVS